MAFWALLRGLQSNPFGKIFTSTFFGVGLSMIVFTEAELFTSNCFYMAISSFAKKTAAIVLVVSIFLYLGFEHSIANRGTFSFAIVGGGALTVGSATRNPAVSAFGNLLGGALLVGWAHTVLGLPPQSPKALNQRKV